MHVVAPATYKPRPKPKPKRRWPWLVLAVVMLAFGANYIRPLPATTATISVSNLTAGVQPAIAWPAYGQAAIGATGYDVLATNGAQTSLATASIAKVITALCVLQKQPLTEGQAGPTYTVSAADVAIYNTYTQQNGSVVNVTEGEQLTEYQALEALLLPSANNIADSLVNWVFGSHTAYVQYATDYLTNHGLTNTHIGSDASGFDASTTSTATDLTKLGLLAQQSPALMAIAAEAKTTLPIAGTVMNYNTVLGVNGINGLKTGNNDANPGAFLFTAAVKVGNTDLQVDGTVLGAPDLGTALHDSTVLAASIKNGFEDVTVAPAGQQLGAETSAWGASAPIITTTSLQLVHWKAARLYETHTLRADVQSGTIGKLQVTSGTSSSSTALKLKHELAGPSFWWRLTRH